MSQATKTEQTKIKNIYEKLFDFQQEDLNILKSKSAHQYKYAPLDDIMDIVKPALVKHKLIIIHELDCELVEAKDGQIHKVEYLKTKIVNVENPSEKIICSTEVKYDVQIGSMNKIMVIGAQITYLRRYHVVCLLGLTTEEDTDVNPTSSAKGSLPEKMSEGPDYVKIFSNQIDKGKDKASLLKSLENYKAKMTEEQFTQVEKMINEKAK